VTQVWTQIGRKVVKKSTHFVAILGLGLLYLGLSTAHASATSDAQAALNKAYNDYYTALRSGPAKTPDQQAQLRAQIIGPAESALNKAMSQDASSFDPNKAARANSVDTSPSANSRSNLGNFGMNNGTGGGTTPAPNSTPTSTETESAPIEGSAPKEIEFPGPYAPSKPTPSPTSSPTKSRTR
jgi:hypothetical protein